VNPYMRLKLEAAAFARQVLYPTWRTMFVITATDHLWEQVKQRTIAARQLGHDVVLSVTDDGKILLSYRKTIKDTDVPWEFRP
jgi:hypothetical protein